MLSTTTNKEGEIGGVRVGRGCRGTNVWPLVGSKFGKKS